MTFRFLNRFISKYLYKILLITFITFIDIINKKLRIILLFFQLNLNIIIFNLIL